MQQDCTEIDTTYDSTLGDFVSEPEQLNVQPIDEDGIWPHRCGLVVLDDGLENSLYLRQLELFQSFTWDSNVSDEPGSMCTTGASNSSYHAFQKSGICDEILTTINNIYDNEYQIILQPPSDYFTTKTNTTNNVSCPPITLNQSTYKEEYNFHIDLDPSGLAPSSTYTQQIGTHINGLPGRPQFVTAQIYVVETWEAKWRAETLFLDSEHDSGVFVLPKRNRLVLFSQDLTHSLTPPAKDIPPRASLAQRQMFVPKDVSKMTSIHKQTWGVPYIFK